MAKSQINFGEVGGGGNAVSGEGFYDSSNVYQTSTTTTSQDMRIETGLSSVKRFMLRANPTYYTMKTYTSVLEYDADVDSTKYGCCCMYSSGAYGSNQLAVGTGSHNQGFRLVSISGGTVTLKSASATHYGECDNIRWFAE